MFLIEFTIMNTDENGKMKSVIYLSIKFKT